MTKWLNGGRGAGWGRKNCLYLLLVKKKVKQLINKKKKPTGRAPQAVYTNARAFVMQVIGGEDGIDRIVHKVFLQALKGSYKHQELLLNYILGKPLETVKLQQYGTPVTPSPAVVKIIADHLRLERLNKDAEAAPVITEDRIKEMEDTLNKHIDGEVSS